MGLSRHVRRPVRQALREFTRGWGYRQAGAENDFSGKSARGGGWEGRLVGSHWMGLAWGVDVKPLLQIVEDFVQSGRATHMFFSCVLCTAGCRSSHLRLRLWHTYELPRHVQWKATLAHFSRSSPHFDGTQSPQGPQRSMTELKSTIDAPHVSTNVSLKDHTPIFGTWSRA